MNKYIIFLALTMLAAVSCKTKTGNEKYLEQIEVIENGLLPMVIIDGEETVTYNIYDRMRDHNVPGVSIAFLDNGEIIWAKGYGYTGFDSIKPIDPGTLFQAASISKPIAALAALHLVEEGKLGLDTNVNDYIIGWQVEDNRFTTNEKVTLRRLLSHSAGLTVHGFAGYGVNDTIPSIIQVLDGESPANSGRIFPDTVPGSIYSYSGGGYTVMQKMLCDITGKDFPVIMDEYVLKPIGMESSTYKQPLPGEMETNAAMGYYSDGSMVEGKWHTYPEMAAAGLWTTPTDILKYALEVQNSVSGKSNKIISREMAREMLTPQKDNHGLGPGVGGKNLEAIFSHGGANEGYRCQFQAFSHGGQGVAIMTNSESGALLMGEILRSFSNLYNWKNYRPINKKIIEIDNDTLSKLAGKYLLEIPGDSLIIRLSVIDNHLEGIQVWDEFQFEIFPESSDLFFNKEDLASFEFTRNDRGDINGVIIQEQWNFKRIAESR